jgi:predicted ribosome quality control (RQC) complex YloA/Tae2 family protein
MLAAVDAAAREAQIEDSPSKHAQRRARLIQAISRYRERVVARLESLHEQQRRSLDAEALRRKGELIYAYIWMIRPGQSTLEAENETIELDSTLSASENAQRYFEQYRKLQSADEQLPALIAAAEGELRYLDEATTLASQVTRFEDIEAISVEWDRYERDHGVYGPAPAKSYRRSAPPKRTRPFHDPDGFLVYLGRSGAENDRITFDVAGPDDYWLHARGTPGSHVVVRARSGGDDELEGALQRAASLAAYFSGARSSGTVEVDIAKRRDVRKIKGAGPGMVTYRNERTIAVRPASETELGLTIRSGE